MVMLKAEKLRALMDKPGNIRHVTILASQGDGKCMITDSLVAAAGIVSQEVTGDVVDPVEELDLGFSLYYQMTDESLKPHKDDKVRNEYLINVTDLPESFDFSPEVAAALRITDGALVVVHGMEGLCPHVETMLGQALGERIRPILAVDKMERCLFDLQIDGEEAYQNLSEVIGNVNASMAIYEDTLGDVLVYPDKRTVVFSASLHGWAFTLSSFAKMYASKFGVDESKMMERLWGENFFDPGTKEWTSYQTGASSCKRGFVQFCYEVIREIISTCMNGEKDKLWSILQNLNVTIKPDDKELMGEALMKRVMQTWLPASTALLETIIFQLPSPAKAQQYRVQNLYDGPQDDRYASSIRNCDPDGSLMLYISKMVPASDKGKFFAFGRVFSGRVVTGMKVRIIGLNCVPDNKNSCMDSVQHTVIWVGKRLESVGDVPCANIAAIFSFDQLMANNATVTNEEEVDACSIGALQVSSYSTVSDQVEKDVELDRFKRLLQEAEVKNEQLVRRLKSARKQLKKIKSENHEVHHELERSEQLKLAHSNPESSNRSAKVLRMLANCHDIILCANEVGATELLHHSNEPDAAILCVIEIPGASKDPVWDFDILEKLTPLGKAVILGMIDDIYSLHIARLSLCGEFTLEDFYWTVNQKVKLSPRIKNIAVKRNRTKMNMDYNRLPKLIREILARSEIPIPGDLERLLKLLESADPCMYRALIRYNFCLMDDIAKRCYAITMFTRMVQLDLKDADVFGSKAHEKYRSATAMSPISFSESLFTNMCSNRFIEKVYAKWSSDSGNKFKGLEGVRRFVEFVRHCLVHLPDIAYEHGRICYTDANVVE